MTLFFFALAIFLACTVFAPWWGLSVAAFVLGLLCPRASLSRHLWAAIAAGAAQAAGAVYQDGRNFGLISQRLSGLFSLPGPYWMFALVGAIAFISALLWQRAGLGARQLLRPAKK